MTLHIEDLTIYHQDNILISLDSLSVCAGKIYTIMGPSGCGKSTLLAWLAGLLPPSLQANGRVFLHQREITDLPVEKRRIALMFQEHRLFPHLRVIENLQFALPSAIKGGQRKNKSLQALHHVKLAHKAYCYPHQLSGGQKARVHLLRSLLAQPQAILLDEPFNGLDQDTACATRQWVFSQIRAQSLPCLLVTHHQDDIADPCAQLHLSSRKNDA